MSDFPEEPTNEPEHPEHPEHPGQWAYPPNPWSGQAGWTGQAEWTDPERPADPAPAADQDRLAGQTRRLRRHGTRPAVAAALAVGTLGATAAITHELWPVSTTTRAAASGTPTTPSTPSTPSGNSSSSGTGTGSSTTEGSGAPSDVSSIAAKVDPALVDINVTFGYQQTSGAGTGIVLTSTGEILTNNHVIDGATSIKVTDIGNGKTYTATVVGYDAADDVAVLQLNGASGLQTASIASSSTVKTGTPVVAVGNAGGTGGTPTAAGGSVTAVNQSITAGNQLTGTEENLTDLIETNADVQEGDSGGALVNSAGQVIGMDTAAAQGYSLQSANSAYQGYAIPIGKALAIAQKIESGQASSTVHVGSTAFLGVLISSSGSSGSSQSGIPGGFQINPYDYGNGTTSGAVVSGVVSGGSAQQAGLSAGDVITAIDGQTVSSSTTLSSIISADKPGQTVKITWTDTSGQSHTASVQLASGPAA